MKKRWSSGLLVLLILMIVLAGAGCSANKVKITSEMKMQATRLAQDFANELQSFILPARENDEKLVELGLTVEKQKETLNFEQVLAFAGDYENGRDATVTFAFSTTSFVVTRIAFRDGVGYYMRYQYDPGEEVPVVRDSTVIKSASLNVDEDRGSASLRLSNDKTFTFKNINGENEAEE